MKHYYIYTLTRNICCFSYEKPRQGFLYLGHFANEDQVEENIYHRLEQMIEINNKAKINLRLENFNDILMYKTDTASGLIGGLMNEMELNQSLTAKQRTQRGKAE